MYVLIIIGIVSALGMIGFTLVKKTNDVKKVHKAAKKKPTPYEKPIYRTVEQNREGPTKKRKASATW